MSQTLISVKEASELTKLSIGTVYSYIYNKRIPYVKVGERKVVFDQDELQKWVEARKQKALLPLAEKEKKNHKRIIKKW